VKKDVDEAIRWYTLGAERGDTWGASNLAWIYSKGPKQMRNPDEAVWYSALAKAVDVYGDNPDAGSELKDLPPKAKARAIRRLVDELGAGAVETASDLDQTLIILSRKLWQKNNPRYDLF
jgi:TPR repeat protein